MFNLFKSCITDFNDSDNHNTYDSNHLMEEQKTFAEPLYDINNQFDPYVQIFDNALTDTECNEIIKLFENSNNHHKNGQVAGEIDGNSEKLLRAKYTRELYISQLKNYPIMEQLDSKLYNNLKEYLNKYVAHVEKEVGHMSKFGEISDTGYQLQKYKKKKGYYVNHVDCHICKENNIIKERVLTYIWYLNDIEVGGETNLVGRAKIKPKTGRFLLFPANWDYPHAGLVPISHDKYIITGWIYTHHKL